jgi:hypothetical protein
LRVVIKVGSRKDLGRPELQPRDCFARFGAFLLDQPWAGPNASSDPEAG